VTVTIHGQNDAPVVNNDEAYETDEDTTLEVSALAGVLANDTDIDGDTLTAILVDGLGPHHGTLTLNPDGSFTYTPDENFHGLDGFSYRVSDGTVESDAIAVTITVNPVNDAPVAAPDTYGTPNNVKLIVASPGVLLNDTDPDGDGLVASLVSGPSHGTLTLLPSGSFTYQANAGFVGADTFVYEASDGLASSQATVTINVTATNAKPIAVNDPNPASNPNPPHAGDYSTTANSPLSISAALGVLANDIDADGDLLTAFLFSNPSNPHKTPHGSVTLNLDGSFTYTPDLDYVGTDVFMYYASDGKSLSNLATVTIRVLAPLLESLAAEPAAGLLADELLIILAADQVA
jgi:VCBS repeat-containing protein